MIGDKLFDCQEMFRHACAFAETADLATGKFEHDTADISWYTTPAAVNSAFACEVYLKALLNFYDIEQPKKHKLRDLYDLLPEKEREFVKGSTINQTGRWTNLWGCELLDNISEAFVKWRYIFERDWNKEGSVIMETSFLTAFRNSFREACCQLFFGMTWEKYKTNINF